MLSTNHWFVAHEEGGELRISAWKGRNRLRSAARHLCGHKCLHKLVDDFTAKSLNLRTTESDAASGSNPRLKANRAVSIKSEPGLNLRLEGPESSARLIVPSQPCSEKPSPSRLYAEAWKRERERQEKSA